MTGAIKVLLIEDSPSDARITAELLGEDTGFEPTHVERLSEATARLGSAPDLPIIVYSGFGADDLLFARTAVRGGAQDFLPKTLATPAAMRHAIVTSMERKRPEQFRVRHACHDPLASPTGCCWPSASSGWSRAERQGKALGVLAIEPDGYPQAVEQMGRAFADALLRAVAERLQANIRRSDPLARVRECGFVALLEGLGGAASDALAGKLRRLMAPAFCIDGQEFCLTASVGIALFRAHGRRLDELLELAEAACSMSCSRAAWVAASPPRRPGSRRRRALGRTKRPEAAAPLCPLARAGRAGRQRPRVSAGRGRGFVRRARAFRPVADADEVNLR
jgi:diguanylate cyclase (GGDEF)-like protein